MGRDVSSVSGCGLWEKRHHPPEVAEAVAPPKLSAERKRCRRAGGQLSRGQPRNVFNWKRCSELTPRREHSSWERPSEAAKQVSSCGTTRKGPCVPAPAAPGPFALSGWRGCRPRRRTDAVMPWRPREAQRALRVEKRGRAQGSDYITTGPSVCSAE